MAKKTPSGDTGKPRSAGRKDRLAEALRANLRRRKDQKRRRETGAITDSEPKLQGD